jgi:hypothetical protein
LNYNSKFEAKKNSPLDSLLTSLVKSNDS